MGIADRQGRVTVKLAEMFENRVARYCDRREDWSTFSLETSVDPAFARAQRRYIGASGSVEHQEVNSVAPAAFTMSLQTMPVGHRIPVHCHETEETFFILEGECTVTLFHEGESLTLRLGKWDLVSIPPFMYHDVCNVGDIPCPVQTMLSKPRPDRPHYQDPRLQDIQKQTYTA
jgi:quercetin dioxygenase-like cupin family protein